MTRFADGTLQYRIRLYLAHKGGNLVGMAVDGCTR